MMKLMMDQSEMVVQVSRYEKVEDSVDSDLALLFSRMVQGWVLVVFNDDKKVEDLEPF